MDKKRILVPVDVGSKVALHALAPAAALARELEAEVVLAHVIDLEIFRKYGARFSDTTVTRLRSMAGDFTRDHLAAQVEPSPLRDVSYTIEVSFADHVARALLERIQAPDVRLAVMAVRITSFMGRRLLGDVAGRIMWAAPRPVLFVPGNDDAPPAESRPFRHLLLATDFSEASRSAARELAATFRPEGRSLTLVHVAGSHQAEDEESEHELMSRLQEEARQFFAGWKPELHVLAGKPSHRIAEYAEDNGVDLVVMGTQGRHALTEHIMGSTSSRLVRLLPSAVLLVPEPGEARKTD